LSRNSFQLNKPATGFTLVELIVVMVIMTILAGLSAIAYRGIAADLRMSSAVNTVVAALDNARALAIKKNRYIMTVFRPRISDDGSEQVIDIVVAEWNGDSASANTGSSIWTFDRFIPVQGVQIRTIEGGVNVAGPGYGTGADDTWWCASFLPSILDEPYGSMVGVLYNPEGRVVVRNAESGADRIWIDYDLDWIQQFAGNLSVDWQDPDIVTNPWNTEVETGSDSFKLAMIEGEPFISMTLILSVFNEKEFRTSVDTTSWTNSSVRDNAYTAYIDANADRIQFDRYSGVPIK